MNVEEYFYYLIEDGTKAVHVLGHDFGQIRVPFREYRARFTFWDTLFADYVSRFVNRYAFVIHGFKCAKKDRSLMNSGLI